MRFNPILAARHINESYRDYMKSTFYIRDEEFRNAYFDELDKFDFSNGPYLECIDAFEQGKSLEQLVEEGMLSPSFERLLGQDPRQYKRSLYKHQEQAIRIAVADKNMVVTTGTGSGKTECFLYPILNHLLEEECCGTLGPGVRVLLLYPMNALANDQMQRLRELLREYPSITFGAYTGETEQKRSDGISQYRKLHNGEDPLPNELTSRDQMKETPPQILVTNYAMLEYLLIRPADNVFFDDPRFSGYWKTIVLDEAHVYSGASGMEVSILLRRLIHRLPNSDNVRCILTSATLGDESNNKEIINFATSLCAGKQFTQDSIIRAVRRVVTTDVGFIGDEDLYTKIANLISEDKVQLKPDDPENLAVLLGELNAFQSADKWIDTGAPFQQILYEVFSHDSLYAFLRDKLVNGAVSMHELSNACPISEDGLLNFIQIASYAVKDGGKLLDARYHHFIRTLEGAYVSFFPKKTLSLVPRKTVKIGETESRCFKLSVCQFCGELYLSGTLNGNEFTQEEGEAKQYFLIIQPEFLEYSDDDDLYKTKKQFEKRRNTHKLCTKCGKVASFQNELSCGCGAGAQVLLYLAPRNRDDGILHSCSYCKTSNPRGSVLRGFYLGQDASIAVVGESLFEQIPETLTKAPNTAIKRPNTFLGQEPTFEPKKTRRLLLFSDSRQEAAYFASYFQYTYDVVFKRRIMMKAARGLMDTFPEDFKGGIPLPDLVREMEKLFRTLQKDDLGPSQTRREVWKTIISEFKDLSRNSLHSIGWLDYRLSDRVKIQQDLEPEGVSLTSAQFNAISHFFLEYFMFHGALQIPHDVVMTPEDWGYFDFSKREPLIQKISPGTKSPHGNVKYFVPATKNAITEYLARILPDSGEIHKKLLETIYDDYYCNERYKILVPIPGKQNLMKVNPELIVIKVQDRHRIDLYRCNVCGRITSNGFFSACPSYRCTGKLEPYEFKSSDIKNYFINQYGPASPLFPISIKEHTAQLSKETAQDYQHRFISGDINILSCSTTFEMGVDVGDLETVFMKNVPPKPSNYIQRAGRAGRRLNAAAFSLTFCRLAPHDFYYYRYPKDMINGTISPPSFKIDNLKIVSRHVYAMLLAYYWRQLLADKSQIQDFFNEPSYEAIRACITSLPSAVQDYMKKVIPLSLRGETDSIIMGYRDDILPRVRDMYLYDLQEYERAHETEESKSKEVKNYKLLDWLSRVKRAYQEEAILTVYSRNNLIPKYGFPVDTVTLFTHATSNSYGGDNSRLSLQRDLIQAISDYAPDSQVIADGFMYTSRYIKQPIKRDTSWKHQHIVMQCDNPNCGKIKVVTFVGEEPNGKTECEKCGARSVSPKVMIIPEYGFLIEPEVEKVTTKKPMKTPRTEYFYLGLVNDDRKNSAKKYSYDSIKLSVISSPDDKLLVMNKSDFLVCQTCGYAKKSTGQVFDLFEHSTPRGTICPSKKLIKRSLGHIFKTDVTLLSFNRHLGGDEAMTILYTLLEGCSRYFDIERDDIDGCVSYQSYAAEGAETGTTFVLFDSVPGGAGNVKRIYDAATEDFHGFLQSSLNRVLNCTCGTDGDTVCYSCLCNFRNQYYQDVMKRRYAIQFLDHLLT